ncbi:endonuclease III [Buchnera aphidicola (Nipponaphis monzeni)]|uniref:Endonuclease III n=1 Tax=Buchnera aphidicola (Nipponaphis monzeni) TaxID=2495405 RepID=A0A455T9X9_9GAMM|nr:endonuclease III [Buchnera aphidicola]BBI01110.1 endonuclease III [Buchnera aphidicola (Nipponaphis monzeni)]
MNNNKRIKILKIFQLNNKFPLTELYFNSNFQLLISVMLSAQATDKNVNKVTKKLYNYIKEPKDILLMGINTLRTYIKSVGLYNIKSSNIIKTCHILINKHHGKIPNSRKQLEMLPGVGRKTANVILNTIFKKKTIAVDTHVFRVCNRTKFVIGSNVKEIEYKLIKVVPDNFKLNFHNWFLLHGRYICQAKWPKCNICNINMYCEYHKKK